MSGTILPSRRQPPDPGDFDPGDTFRILLEEIKRRWEKEMGDGSFFMSGAIRRNTYYNWTGRKGKVRPRVLRRLCMALGCSADDIGLDSERAAIVDQISPYKKDVDEIGLDRPNLLRKWGILAHLSPRCPEELQLIRESVFSVDSVPHAPTRGFYENGDWRTVLESAVPFNEVPDVFAGDNCVRLVGGALERKSGPTQPWIELRGVVGAATEVRATFGYPGWARSVRIGLAMRAKSTKQPSYQFMLGSFGPEAETTFDDSRESDKFVAARIVRNGVIVREHRWRASALPTGPLEMTVNRLGNHFALHVAGLQPNLELIDLMPLVPCSEPADFALDWPADATLTGLRVRENPAFHCRSPLDSGDARYNADAFHDASEFFSNHATGDPVAGLEARYKNAVCLTRISSRKLHDAVTLFASVARESSAAPRSDSRRKWAVLAAFQAWRIAQSRHIEIPWVEELEAILTSDPRDDLDYDLMVPALTTSELDEFIKDFAPYAFSTSPYHLLKDDRQRIGLLEQAVRTLDRLDPTGVSAVGPRQELLRAHFSARNYGRAEQMADEVLRRTIDQDWRLTITRDAVWLAIERSRRPGIEPSTARQTLSRGLELVENGLRDPIRGDRFRTGCRSLLVERARLRANLGQLREAMADIDSYLRDAVWPEITPSSASVATRFAPSQNVPALYYLEALLLQGFLREEAGDPIAARTSWDEGVNRARGTVACRFLLRGGDALFLADVIERQDTRTHGHRDYSSGAGFLWGLVTYQLPPESHDHLPRIDDIPVAAELAVGTRARAGPTDKTRELWAFNEPLGIQIRLWCYEGFWSSRGRSAGERKSAT